MELITVLVMLAVLAVVAIPNFTGRGGYAERAAQDELIALARHAQQIAMARGAAHSVSLVISGNAVQIAVDGGPLRLPGGTSISRTLADVTVSDASLAYNALGETAATALTITGEGTRSVCIESTGYAHAC